MFLYICNLISMIFIGLIFVRLMDKTSAISPICKHKFYKILGISCLSIILAAVEIIPYINAREAKLIYSTCFIIFAMIFYFNHFVENLLLAMTYCITYMSTGYSIGEGYRQLLNRGWITYNIWALLTDITMVIAAYFITEYILSNILDYKDYVFTNKEFIALFGFNIVGYITLMFRANFLNNCISTLCAISVLVFSSLIKIIRQKEETEHLLIERNRFLEDQDKLIRDKEAEKYKSYKKSAELDAQVRRINHDLMHHFNYLLSCEGLPKQAQDYINGLKGVVEASSNHFDTGSSILDLVLEEKCRSAEKLGSKFKVMGDFSEGLSVEPASISVIFGNLLNNALEGVSKVPKDEYRTIDLIFYEEPHKKFYLKISNTADTTNINIDEDGKIETSKEDKELHGIGMGSVRKEVENYGGTMKVLAEDNTFIVEIIIPLN